MSNHWSKDEDDVLTRLWKRQDITTRMLSIVFVDRTVSAIKSRAVSLGLRKDETTHIDYDALKAIEI